MYHLVSDKGLVSNTRRGAIEPSVARTEALSLSPPSTLVPSDRVQALIMSWVSLAAEGPLGE